VKKNQIGQVIGAPSMFNDSFQVLVEKIQTAREHVDALDAMLAPYAFAEGPEDTCPAAAQPVSEVAVLKRLAATIEQLSDLNTRLSKLRARLIL